MRIVIGGAGEVGRGVAKALRTEGRDVVLIDSDPVAIKEEKMSGEGYILLEIIVVIPKRSIFYCIIIPNLILYSMRNNT